MKCHSMDGHGLMPVRTGDTESRREQARDVFHGGSQLAPLDWHKKSVGEDHGVTAARLEDVDAPRRLEHTGTLGYEALRFVEVVHQIADEHMVESPIRERKFVRGADHEPAAR